jgi:hypothetical protein
VITHLLRLLGVEAHNPIHRYVLRFTSLFICATLLSTLAFFVFRLHDSWVHKTIERDPRYSKVIASIQEQKLSPSTIYYHFSPYDGSFGTFILQTILLFLILGILLALWWFLHNLVKKLNDKTF